MRLTDMQRARAQAHEAVRAPANDLVSALRVHVEQRPQQVAVRFLADGESAAHELTYADLDARVRRLAAALRVHAAAGDRVLLMLPSGLDYVVAFFACQYAGMIAVPAYPAEAQHGAHLDRLRGMVGDCAARVAILGHDSQAALEAAGLASALADTVLLAPDAGGDDGFCIDTGNPDALSFLQYTSGSTSAPKGVMVSQSNVCANIDAIASAMDYRSDDRMLCWLPLYHDMGLIGGMLASIICGFPLSLMAPPHFLERPARWLQRISSERATVSGGPDFAFRLCLDRMRDAQLAGVDLSSWRVAFCGSEPIRQHTLDGFVERFAQWGFDASAIYPCYGLAEATLIVTGVVAGSGAPETRFSGASLARSNPAAEAPANDDDAKAVVGCGIAPPLHTFAIVDPVTEARMPDGRVGEIWCAGPSIAQGYWQNPTASDAVFIERPGFDGRWLRTGDLGFVESGQLYVCGRRKDMIVVRGQNVYPQDIEVALADRVEWLRRGRISAFPVDLPDGAEAIGIAAEVPRGKTRQIAHETIFGAIANALGDAFQHEAGLMLLLEPGDLPRTSSGKLQRSACLHEWRAGAWQPFAVWSVGSNAGDGDAHTGALKSPLEAFIAQQWQHVLPVAALARDDDFFHVGGQSIAAVQLASRLGAALQITLPVGRVFAHRTIAAQAALLAREFNIDVDAEIADTVEPTIPQPQAVVPIPASGLSAGQRSLWFLWRLAPASAAYNLSATLRLDGTLDVARLRDALSALIARHPELRSRFAERDGEPLRTLSDDASYGWREHDLSSFDAAQRDAHAFACANAAASEPVDLVAGPMLRATLVRIAPTRSLLTVSIHHIVSDAASFGILCDELVDAYRGATLPPLHGWSLPVAVDPATLARERAFWIERLGANHPRLALPEETPASTTEHAEAGRAARTVPHALAQRLARLASEHGASRFASLLAAFVALLHRVSGQHDVRVGMPASLRRSPADDDRVGYFVNTVVIRADVSRDLRFSALVEQIGTRVIEALEHRDLPFADLVDALQPERRNDHTSLFNVMFNEQAVPMGARDANGLVVEPLEEQRGSAQFDLTLNVVTGGADLRVLLDYPAQRFDAATVERLLDQYLDVLVAVTGNDGADLALGALPFAGGAQPGDALPAHRFVPVHARFAQHARVRPDACAVSCGNDSITYRELDRWSDRIAARLLAEGVEREAPVAVCIERSIALIAACFGVLKAGAAYVPLDPGYPAARLAAMLDDANVRCVVTDAVGVACLGDALASNTSRTSIDASALRVAADSTAFEAAAPEATNLAYVIYTSGSTGRPKGVAVPHGAFDRLVASIVATVGVDERDTWLAVTSPSFDISLLELCLPLTVGARIELAPREVVRDGARLAALLDKSHATILQATPASWRLLLAGGWSHRSDASSDNTGSRLKGLCGGEALASDLADALLARGADVWNVYGPTETTIWSTCGAVRAQAPVTLGHALHHTQLQLHDLHGDATPAGGVGELCIGGDNLARGYLGRPGLTAERFVPDPHGHGTRVYRTGDLSRVRGDGRLDYLGRIDHQIKLRGHRIEPGDIEAALRRCEGVRDAVVMLREDGGPARLVGYVAAHGVSSATLLDTLAATLPGFMVPSTVVVLDTLPLTPSGKINRRALPAPVVSVSVDASQADAHDAALSTPTEHAVADAWHDVLGIARPGVGAHFFELGGHSLLALKVVSRLQQRLSRDVPLDLLFSHPTLGEFAAALDNTAPETHETALLPRNLRDAPLSLPQERLWVLWRLDPDSAAYNVSGALELDGAFDAHAAQRALDALVQRHAMLRTRFAEIDDMPRQVILAPEQSTEALRWETVDVQDAKDRASLAAQLRVRAREPFDLEHGPLLRATLFTLAPQRYVLHFVMHHIASDGWSIDVLLREFAAGYRAARRGETSPLAALPALPVQYADYAAWQRERFDGAGRAVLDTQLAYWRDRLAGLQSTIDLPTEHDRSRPYDPRGARVGIRIPASLAARAEALARDEGATLFMVLLAALDVLLYRYSGATDVPVAVPVAGRDRLETEGLIGFFVNTLVMRATLSGAQPFAALLQQVRADSIAAQAHRDVPFDRVVADLQLERRASGNPLAQVKLMVHDGFDAALDLDGVQCRLLDADESDVRFELALDIARGPQGLDCTFVYAADVYDEMFIAQFARHYADLLTQAVDDPQRTLGAFALRDDDEAACDALPVSSVGMS